MVRVVDDIDHLRPGLRFVATVGVFDGVHLGHAHVLGRLRELADELAATPVAVTFDPHPQAVITGRVPDLICDPFEKLARMAEAGAAAIVVQRFDEAFRAQTAEEFLERLARGRDLAGLVMSHESAFGRDRQGTVDTVRRLARRDGFRLVEVDTLEVDGEPVSSSRIRAAVGSGDLATAERLLGRRYAITGQVACDPQGRWTLAPMGPVTLPPAGAYAATASWHLADAEGVRLAASGLEAAAGLVDPLRPEQVGLGSLAIGATAPEALEVRPAPVDARDAVVRVQLVASVRAAPSDAQAGRGPLQHVREGDVTIRAEELPEAAAVSRAARAHPADDAAPLTFAYVAHWRLAGTPSGLAECCYPAFGSVDDALEWARARSTRITLLLPGSWPRADPSSAEVVAWSAGDDPIDGLRRWDDRRLGEG